MMQEQVTFQLSPMFLETEPVDSTSLMVEVSSNLTVIESLLVSYHFKSRGRVFNVQLVQDSVVLLSDSMGKFTVVYTIGQFNACADVDFAENASMEMLIDIDRGAGKAIITGEYIPEREPDEF
jgi:hypothetical protein